MKSIKANPSLISIVEKLNHLNLDPIKIKLMDQVEGEGWTKSQADKADLMYRRFLYLTAKYPDAVIVPNKVIDKVWHSHILDTRKYREDCEYVFGYFVHHFPYLGMRGDDDAQLLCASFDETMNLYLAEFGELAFDKEEFDSSTCNSQGNCWPEKCSSKCNVKKSIDNSRPSFAEDFQPVNIFEGSFELVT